MSEVDYIRLSGPRPVTMRGRAAFSTSWARDSVDRRDPLEEGITENAPNKRATGPQGIEQTVIQLLRRAGRVIATRRESTSTRALT